MRRDIHILALNGHVNATAVMNPRMASNGLGQASVKIDAPAIRIKSAVDQML